MKKVILAAVVATSFTAPQAFAQAKNFEGFSVAGGLNVATSKYEDNRGVAFSGTSTNGIIEGQYAAALGEKFVLAGGATLGLGDLKAGTYNNIDIKLKDVRVLYVKPGYAVSNNVLVYGKLASVAATAQVVTTVDLTGTAYALGVQVMSGKNVYYQAEYLQTKYDEKAKENFNVSTVSFVVGYKF